MRAALCAFSLALAFMACSSPEDRAADHVARAEALLAEPEGLDSLRDAALELRNAIQLRPDDAHAHRLLGRTLLRMGVTVEAIAYLEDAQALAPDDPDIAVELARAKFFVDPEAANALAEQVRADHPDHLEALLVAAEAKAVLGDYELGLARLVEAERAAPGHPDIEWSRARVYEAKVRALRLKPGRTLFAPGDFEAMDAAYDAYIEKGGELPGTVLLSKAKLYTAWPGHRAQAPAIFIEAAGLAGDDAVFEIAVWESLSQFARATGDVPHRLRALEHLNALEPHRIDRWEEHVRLALATERPVAPILDAMLEAAGDDPRSHVVYARTLRDVEGLDAAVSYLRAQIDETDDDALLLSNLVQLQTRGGRPEAGDRTLEELQSRHPDHVETRLLLARRAMRDGEPEAAVDAIASLAEQTGHRDALRVWARATEQTGDLAGALEIVERMIDSRAEFDAQLWSWKADLLYGLGEPAKTLAALERIDWGAELTPAHQLLRARCEYDLGRDVAGRQRLLALLEAPQPLPDAALEFAKRERDNPASQMIALEALGAAYERAPGRIDLLEELTRLELAMGRPGMAMQRLTLTIGRRPKDPALYALRAQLRLELGRLKGARADAERALLLTPGEGDDALTVLIALSESPAQRPLALEVLESQAAEGRLVLHRKVLLGRLLGLAGREAEALALFEEALAEGGRWSQLKTDTARLLVQQGGDLGRAEQLAREVVEMPGKQVSAADALGLVYLAKGQPDAAMWQFRFAAENAEPPATIYFHHLAQALVAMDRDDEARAAYARALEIDPDDALARGALEALGTLGAVNEAPASDPS